jgi:hypothetical protein
MSRMYAVAALLLMFVLGSTVHAEPAYQVGENLFRNPQWKNLNARRIPAEWERLVLRPQANATIAVDRGGVLHIVFNSNEWVDQARLKQQLTIKPGQVYELSYDYKTGEEGKTLRADISAIGTGPIYRSIRNAPSTQWVHRKFLFHIPENAKDKTLPAGDIVLMFQNRSMGPIWYRNPSLRETDINPELIDTFQPEVRLQSLTSEDVMIMPGSTARYAQFVASVSPESAKENLQIEAKLFTPDKKTYDAEIVDGRVRVALENIPAGKSRLYLYAYKGTDQSKRTLVSFASHDIERISPDQIPGDMDFSQHLPMTTPTGEPIFPIGIYAGLGWNFSINQLANAGFNTIHTYGTDSWRIRDENFKLLNEAHERGVWIMMGLPPRYIRSGEHLKELRDWMNAYKGYPAILKYYADETYTEKGVPPAIIRRVYDTVKKTDPSRPFYSYEKPDENIRGTMDGIMLGISNASVTKVVKLRMGNIPMIHVFGQGDHHGQKAQSLEWYQYEFVMPVLYGARGVYYWTLRAITETNLEGNLIRERLYQTSSRFAQAAPAIVSDQANPDWAQNVTASGNAEYLVKTRDGRTYVLCGVHRDGGEGSLEIPVPAGSAVRDVLADEAISLTDGNKLKISLQGGQVKVLEIKSSQ